MFRPLLSIILASLASSFACDPALAAPPAPQVSIMAPSGESQAASARLQEGRVETKYVVPIRSSVWEKNYTNGFNALEERKFEHAEKMLTAAIKEAKSPGAPDTALVHSRLALALLYLKQRRYPEAYDLYRSTLNLALSRCGAGSREVAECKYGLSRCEVFFGDEKAARENAESAIEILKRTGKIDSTLGGLSVESLALALARFGWYDDSKLLFGAASEIMEAHPGYKKLDLADSLREQALFYHARGDRSTAARLYERSAKIKDAALSASEPAAVLGEVDFVWEAGSTRSREIIDNEFPFRYVTANGIRVAATIIDLWELVGILVTVTNTEDQQREFVLGDIVVEKVDKRYPKRRSEVIPSVDANSIDRVQKELSIWALTHTRPWLANIQKTRTVRGLVPPDGHDMFRGPNVFGVWGNWKAVSHTVPKLVAITPSREGLQRFDRTEVPLPGLLSRGTHKIAGKYPVYLEPFESRTGELFYLNHRDVDIVIKVPVGNAVFELPFHTRKKFSH
ncbi:MAG: tetratricopeptide repeat protein [Candidatus Melainabacteria bacterium]|nr:tetratricopeptide repeat protein [Candidatus Melainabacteria bacterium]